MQSSALEEIKSRLDIVELISDYVQLKKFGHNYKGLCPFHAEKTPSFMVSPEKQIFHCFGCGAGGDVFGFVIKHENLTFHEALSLLAKKAGVTLKPGGGPSGEKEPLREMQSAARSFFAEALERSAKAKAYLKGREISEKSLKDFSLGYAPEGWHQLYGILRGKGYKDALILQSGLVAAGQKGLYDIFRARIMFPISDFHGDIVAFGGRVIDDGQPKYLNSPDTPLFRKGETLYALNKAKDEIKKRDCAMIVEGYLDVISCHQNGFGNAVAPLGTALTQGHLKKLGRLTENILLVFDGDEAGISAAKRTLPLILEHELRARVLLLPEGGDPDSILRGKGQEVFGELISKAQTPVEFVIARFKTGESGGRTGAIKEAIGLISRVKDPLVRDEFIRELSDRAGAREATIREYLKKGDRAYQSPGRAAGRGPGEKASGMDKKGSVASEELILLSAAVHAPEKISYILENIEAGELKDSAIREIFGRLSDNITVQEAAVTEEEKALTSRLSIRPGFDLSSVDENIEDCIKKIRLRRLNETIKGAERAGDLKLLAVLLADRQKLIRRKDGGFLRAR